MMQIRCSAKNDNLYNKFLFQNTDHRIVLATPLNRVMKY